MRRVILKKKIVKAVAIMPKRERILFDKLVEDLKEKGPVLPNWPNYKKLTDTNTYHLRCHQACHYRYIRSLQALPDTSP